jgi:hypothetical protein
MNLQGTIIPLKLTPVHITTLTGTATHYGDGFEAAFIRLTPKGYAKGYVNVLFILTSMIHSSSIDYASETYKIEYRREKIYFTHFISSYALGSLFD